jgi:hypothetical protein
MSSYRFFIAGLAVVLLGAARSDAWQATGGFGVRPSIPYCTGCPHCNICHSVSLMSRSQRFDVFVLIETLVV